MSMIKQFTVLLMVLISLVGCDSRIQEVKSQEMWDKEWYDSCEKQWTNFECRLLYKANDNADRARLLEGFRKDRDFRNKDKK